MNWIQDNKFLTGWLAVTLLGILGLGFLLLQARGQYNTAYAQFDSGRKQVLGLESKPLYPSAENVELKGEVIDEYEAAVNDLHTQLAQFQRPLRPVEQTAFQAKLKNRIQQLSREAAKKSVKLPEDFAFGMLRYVNTLPPIEACPMLDYQLDSIFSLTSSLVSHQVDSIESIERKLIPGEKGAPEKSAPEPPKRGAKAAPEPVLERFPVEIVCATGPEPLRLFLNDVSNPSPGSPFHIVRMMRVANEQQLGPPKVSSNSTIVPDFVPEPDLEVTSPDDAAVAQGEEDAESIGFEGEDLDFEGSSAVDPIDARFILGEEKVEVYMKIELLRFTPLANDAENAKEGAPSPGR